MRKELLFKLLQRHTYTCLSHQYGIYFAFTGVVIVMYSMFQFGEELLEWSQSQYDSMFSLYHDNIAGQSFRMMVSAPIPIDIVYTWVNGSDPKLISQLSALKKSLNSDKTVLNTTSNPDSDSVQCNYKHCFPLPCLIASPMLDQTISLSEAQQKLNGLSELKWLGKLEVGKGFLSGGSQNVSVLRFEDRQKMNGAVSNLKEENRTYLPAYITTQDDVPHASLLANGVLLRGVPDKIKSDGLLQKLPAILKDVTDWIHVASAENMALVWTTDVETTAKIFDPKANSSVSAFAIDESLVTMVRAYITVTIEEQTQDDLARSRFEDNEELRYSLRSVEKYAPWVRRVFIVTNGQIPYWLNMDNPRITVITHQEVFINQSHLPTFSSPAIESHIHRIPGLAKKFIYMNDDVMFGREVWPEDFYTHAHGQKIYLTWPVPNCADGCAPTWIKDGFCDSACNISECNWDGGDCTGSNVRPGVGAGGGSYSYIATTYCFPGCADTWLADKFCDQSCNKLECGFDAADCGTSNFDKIYKIRFNMTNGTTYQVPPGVKNAYIDISQFFKKVTQAEYVKDASIRAAAVSNKYGVMTIVYNAAGNESDVRFEITGEPCQKDWKEGQELDAESKAKAFTTVWFNVTAFPSKNVTINVTKLNEAGSESPSEDPDEAKKLIGNATNEKPKNADFAEIITFPEDIKKPKLRAIPSSKFEDIQTVDIPDMIDEEILPKNISDSLHELESNFRDQILTEMGYKRRKFKLLYPYIDKLKAAAAELGIKAVAIDSAQNKTKRYTRTTPMPIGNATEKKDIEMAAIKQDVLQEKPVKPVKILVNQDDVSVDGHEHKKGDTGQEEVQAEVKSPEFLRKKPPDGEGTQNVNPFYRLMKRKIAEAENTTESVANDTGTFTRRKLLSWVEENAPVLNDMLDRILLNQPQKTDENLGFLPWEKSKIFDGQIRNEEEREKRRRMMREYEVGVHRTGRRKPLDTFADSLRYVSNIYNKDFGFTQRKVPAHMPHFIDKDIMIQLQARYTDEFALTSSHQLRHSQDMQFAFSYNYYLMSVPKPVNISDIFHSLDTDGSGVLSDREIRMLATRTHSLPLTLQELTSIEKNLISCAWELYGPEEHKKKEGNSTLKAEEPRLEDLTQPLNGIEPWAVTENYYDKDMPLITEHLVLNCPFMVKMINDSYKDRKQYKHQVMDEEEITFKMIRNNVSTVVGQLDDIRKDPKKFICLNDNINHQNAKEAEMVKAVLRDFYETFFPKESQFELPAEYRNRFLNIYDLREWKEHRDYISSWMRMILMCLLFFTILSMLWDRLESVPLRLHKNRFFRKLGAAKTGFLSLFRKEKRKRRLSNV